eukprot:11099358-Alexandrium_andersonii.AAC.1
MRLAERLRSSLPLPGRSLQRRHRLYRLQVQSGRYFRPRGPHGPQLTWRLGGRRRSTPRRPTSG